MKVHHQHSHSDRQEILSRARPPASRDDYVPGRPCPHLLVTSPHVEPSALGRAGGHWRQLVSGTQGWYLVLVTAASKVPQATVHKDQPRAETLGCPETQTDLPGTLDFCARQGICRDGEPVESGFVRSRTCADKLQ